MTQQKKHSFVSIPEPLVNATINFLATLPYSQSAPLIDAIKTQAVLLPDEEPTPEPSKDVSPPNAS